VLPSTGIANFLLNFDWKFAHEKGANLIDVPPLNATMSTKNELNQTFSRGEKCLAAIQTPNLQNRESRIGPLKGETIFPHFPYSHQSVILILHSFCRISQ
jgi:hypothetical protein